MRWTNALTGGSGTIFAGATWSISSIPLDVGTNVITVVGTNGTSAIVTNAADSGSSVVYGDGWDTNDVGGVGFGGWQFYTQSLDGNQNGRFMANSASVNIGVPAWGLYANGVTNLSEAKRVLGTPMSTGQTFHVAFDNGYIDPGRGVGVGLLNSSGATLWQFFFNGGDNYYSISGGTTDVGWTSAGMDIEFTLTGPTNYSVRISPNGSSARTITGNLESSANSTITLFRAWNYSAGSGSDYDVFFNRLMITGAGSGLGISTSDTVTIIREAPLMHDGIPLAWWNRFGLGTNYTADGNNDGDSDSNWEEYVADTNPTNGSSVFTNRVGQWTADATVMILQSGSPTTNSRVYDVWVTTNLVAPSWSPRQLNVPGATDGGPVTLVVTNLDSRGYYRTGVKLP